ncbi:hypothetical protein [Roseomonas chloroacetimidivorans]|uniref:hypothetical protein n=1 Tax=Roseomonas chloroacetimidivorans TaxID=1766656 RepID=UPI003C75CCF1
MSGDQQPNQQCQRCGGSGIEEVYGGHGTVLELPCSHCQQEASPPTAGQSSPSNADIVCHDEQLRVWASGVMGALSMGDFLRDDLSYDDRLDLERVVMGEIKRIVASAFNHPELNHD